MEGERLDMVPRKPPGGSVCGAHPVDPAVAICSRCGTFVCAACSVTMSADAPCCRPCEPLLRQDLLLPLDRATLGWPTRIAATFVQVVCRPARTFSSLEKGSPARALVFAAAVLVATGSALTAANVVLRGFPASSDRMWWILRFVWNGLGRALLLGIAYKFVASWLGGYGTFASTVRVIALATPIVLLRLATLVAPPQSIEAAINFLELVGVGIALGLSGPKQQGLPRLHSMIIALGTAVALAALAYFAGRLPPP
ncbi:MAG: B-box zinc finger protein [Deltaproteobacteria bacterium]|nr:B-box zinc finger protein [Deltaproteobacteria bacterium]